MTLGCGTAFRGCFTDGFVGDGDGVIYLPADSWIEGKWKNGKPCGVAYHVDENGNRSRGNWIEGDSALEDKTAEIIKGPEEIFKGRAFKSSLKRAKIGP